MQCKAKSENLAHILGYQTGAVTVAVLDKAKEGLQNTDKASPHVNLISMQLIDELQASSCSASSYP